MTGNDKNRSDGGFGFSSSTVASYGFCMTGHTTKNECALNLLMIVFWFFAFFQFLFVIFVSKKEQLDEVNSRDRISSILLLFYGGFAAYNGAVITGAVVIVSGLLYAAKCKLIREGK